MKRKALSKQKRFEIFKRDKFTCQYCGSSAPDVVLEIDHIKPVSKGGGDELLNLITSCKECNSGKSDKTLDDSAAISKQKQQLDLLQERREQIEMMLEWKTGLQDELVFQVATIGKMFFEKTGYTILPPAEKTIKKWLRTYGYSLILDCTILAIDQYLCFENGQATKDSVNTAFEKIGAISYMKQKQSETAFPDMVNYLVNIAAKNYNTRLLKGQLWDIFTESVEDEYDFKSIKKALYEYRSWGQFQEWLGGYNGAK